MIVELMPCLFLCNICARAELRKQERARKLCSATLSKKMADLTTLSEILADNVNTAVFCTPMNYTRREQRTAILASEKVKDRSFGKNS